MLVPNHAGLQKAPGAPHPPTPQRPGPNFKSQGVAFKRRDFLCAAQRSHFARALPKLHNRRYGAKVLLVPKRMHPPPFRFCNGGTTVRFTPESGNCRTTLGCPLCVPCVDIQPSPADVGFTSESRASNGSTSSKLVPRKSVFERCNLPPWSSTIVRQIERPSPVPLGFVVKNGSNILS